MPYTFAQSQALFTRAQRSIAAGVNSGIRKMEAPCRSTSRAVAVLTSETGPEGTEGIEELAAAPVATPALDLPVVGGRVWVWAGCPPLLSHLKSLNIN